MNRFSFFARSVGLSALLAVSATPAFAGKEDRARTAIGQAKGKIDAANKVGATNETPDTIAQAQAALATAQEDISRGRKEEAFAAATRASELADTALGETNRRKSAAQHAAQADANAANTQAAVATATAQQDAANANARAAEAERATAAANAQAEAARAAAAATPATTTTVTTEEKTVARAKARPAKRVVKTTTAPARPASAVQQTTTSVTTSTN